MAEDIFASAAWPLCVRVS